MRRIVGQAGWLALLLLAAGCYVAGAALRSANAAAGTKVMLFGGRGHKTHLGCWGCSQYGEDAILNSYSPYGSAYSATSIFNHYSPYGSPYSQYSACSPYASDPPVLVDGAGKFYGRLTLNRYARGAVTDERVLGWPVCGS